MEYVFGLLGLALLWGIWQASQPRALFTVRLSDGAPVAIASTVTAAFLERVREVAANHNITRGEVRGLVNKEQIRLQFSHEFPDAARQQIRNWWQLHGWPAPRL